MCSITGIRATLQGCEQHRKDESNITGVPVSSITLHVQHHRDLCNIIECTTCDLLVKVCCNLLMLKICSSRTEFIVQFATASQVCLQVICFCTFCCKQSRFKKVPTQNAILRHFCFMVLKLAELS